MLMVYLLSHGALYSLFHFPWSVAGWLPGCEEDINRIQQVIDCGRFKTEQRQVWESFGIAFGTILINEMDGMDWVTVIDGKQEYPALRFADTDVVVYPTKFIWNAVSNGKPCNLNDEYLRIRAEVERTL